MKGLKIERALLLLGSCDASVDVSYVFLIKSCHPKICNLWDPFLVEQNVSSFNVSVDDAVWCVFMEVEQPSSNACYDLKPLLPINLRFSVGFCVQNEAKHSFKKPDSKSPLVTMRRRLTEEDFVEALVGDVLIDQEFVISVCAITPEINHIPMLDFSQQLGLVYKLVFALP